MKVNLPMGTMIMTMMVTLNKLELPGMYLLYDTCNPCLSLRCLDYTTSILVNTVLLFRFNNCFMWKIKAKALNSISTFGLMRLVM